MVFNKKRAAEEKVLIERITSEQERALLWLKKFLPAYTLDFALPTVKLSDEFREKQFGSYALDNIEHTELLAVEKFQKGEITQDELTFKQEELAEKKQRLVIREPMHAAYLANPNTIVYYMENIKKTAKEKSFCLEEYLSRIIIHEMFHAAHCNLCGSEHWRKPTCPREWMATVKEALARYIEYTYSKEKDFVVHTEDIRIGLLDPHKCAPSYPYAGAKKLICEQQVDFIEILELSLTNWQVAYRHLVK